MSFGGRGLPDGSLGPSRSNRDLARRRSALRVGLSSAPFLVARLSVRLLRVDDDAPRLFQEGPQLRLRFPRPSLPRAPFRLPIPATRRVRHPFEPRGGQSVASAGAFSASGAPAPIELDELLPLDDFGELRSPDVNIASFIRRWKKKNRVYTPLKPMNRLARPLSSEDAD